MSVVEDDVHVYALTTCPWCRKTKQWFTDSKIAFEAIDIDTLEGDEQDAAADKAFELSGGRRFPVTVINGEVIVGFNPSKFLEHLKGWGG
ncbi:MAG: glutaredoxin family protein [Thermoleophilia bacterium]